jgi:hypothetical protein
VRGPLMTRESHIGPRIADLQRAPSAQLAQQRGPEIRQTVATDDPRLETALVTGDGGILQISLYFGVARAIRAELIAQQPRCTSSGSVRERNASIRRS